MNEKIAKFATRKLLNNHIIMRKNIVAGNWKMNTTKVDGVALAQDVAAMSE